MPKRVPSAYEGSMSPQGAALDMWLQDARGCPNHLHIISIFTLFSISSRRRPESQLKNVYLYLLILVVSASALIHVLILLKLYTRASPQVDVYIYI